MSQRCQMNRVSVRKIHRPLKLLYRLFEPRFLFIYLAQKQLRDDKRRTQFQRLLKLLNREFVLPNVEIVPPQVKINNQVERIEF